MKKIYLILGTVLFVCSVFLIRFGYISMKDTEYTDAVKDYDYYKSQMEETSSMAQDYGNSGVFGSTYSKLASGWYNLLKDAKKTIIQARIKIGIGFGGGVLCIVFGIVFVVASCKNGKKEEASQSHEVT